MLDSQPQARDEQELLRWPIAYERPLQSTAHRSGSGMEKMQIRGCIISVTVSSLIVYALVEDNNKIQ